MTVTVLKADRLNPASKKEAAAVRLRASSFLVSFGCLVMPSVSALCMNPCMATLAKRDQVAPLMRTTFSQRHFVVDFFYWHHDAVLKAKLTERMRLHIAVTYPLPGSSVSTAYSRISVVLLIAGVLLLPVLFAEPTVSKVWASRNSTRMFRFPWHDASSFPNAARGFSSEF